MRDDAAGASSSFPCLVLGDGGVDLRPLDLRSRGAFPKGCEQAVLVQWHDYGCLAPELDCVVTVARVCWPCAHEHDASPGPLPPAGPDAPAPPICVPSISGCGRRREAEPSGGRGGGRREGRRVGGRPGQRVRPERGELGQLHRAPRRDGLPPGAGRGAELGPVHPPGLGDLGRVGSAAPRRSRPRRPGRSRFPARRWPSGPGTGSRAAPGRAPPRRSPAPACSLRRTLRGIGSPGRGCPQHVFVHTPGQVCLDSARLVSRNWPAALNR